jgi:hypothetical protein
VGEIQKDEKCHFIVWKISKRPPVKLKYVLQNKYLNKRKTACHEA